MRILVTGGAGYIGSHACKYLSEQEHEVHAVDNLFRGHRSAVKAPAQLHEIDVRDTDQVIELVRDIGPIDCVMHFAAKAYVGESVDAPLDYYQNNTGGTLSMLRVLEETGIPRFIFSSTCATYGEATELPISESHTQKPINPYGDSKYMSERMLIDFANKQAKQNQPFAYAILRYFNVCGSADDGAIGEDHRPETHLLPNLILTAMGKRETFYMFGDDYPTPDGTCIRDYVHVEDLVNAHILVMKAIEPTKSTQQEQSCDYRVYNVGTGRGHSIKEAIEAVERVTGEKLNIESKPRRAGDPPELYAAPDKIMNELNWQPKHKGLDTAIQSAWEWFKQHPEGYAD